MACIICGKNRRILDVISIKYESENSLPEVLATAIGSSIASEDWNNGDKKICIACNRRCEEYDKINVRLQDLKHRLVHGYKKAKEKSHEDTYEEAKKTKCQDNAGADDVAETEPTGKIETDSNQNTVEESDDKEKDTGKVANPDDTQHKNDTEVAKDEEDDNTKKSKDKENDIADESENDSTEKEHEDSEKSPLITVTIKNETEGSSDEGSPERDWPSTANLPERVLDKDNIADEISTKQSIRLIEKSKLHRLPDYENRQWFTLDNYCYVLHTENNRGRLLACHKRGCGVSCRVTRQSSLIKLVGMHRHEPELRIVERNKLYMRLKKRCTSDSTTPLMKIYDEEAERYPNGANLLPYPETLMREWRASHDQTVITEANASTLDETGKKYKCEVCNMGFNSSRLLVRHADKHNQSKTTRMKLSGAKSFIVSSPMSEDKKKLKKMMDKKLKRVITSLKMEGQESAAETETEAEVMDCHVCHQPSASLAELKEHILKTHSEVLVCVHCDIAFDTPLLLQRHKTSCRKCCEERLLQQHSTNGDDLEKELSKITGQDTETNEDLEPDPDDPEWTAGKADESTADEGDDEAVPKKKRKNGEMEKIQKCQVCDKTFPSKVQLQTHLYTHSSRKKYECGVCGESFNKKAVLTRHMIAEKHKGRMKLNPPRIDTELHSGVHCWVVKYECAVCGTSYPRQAALVNHMRQQNHVTDQIIVHEAQPPPLDSRRQNARASRFFTRDGPVKHLGVAVGAAKQPVGAPSGRKPLECAACGCGFDTRDTLAAHMESEGHITDCIVENVPMLADSAASEGGEEGNQIVPDHVTEELTQIKVEPNVEILSQVILSHNKHREQSRNNGGDQSYYIQAAENTDGETVMVIEGDLEGSINEDMQLFMDADGNIVTQDEAGNTVQVMQVDLSRMQHPQARDDSYVQVMQSNSAGGLFVDGTGQSENEQDMENILEQTHQQYENDMSESQAAINHDGVNNENILGKQTESEQKDSPMLVDAMQEESEMGNELTETGDVATKETSNDIIEGTNTETNDDQKETGGQQMETIDNEAETVDQQTNRNDNQTDTVGQSDQIDHQTETNVDQAEPADGQREKHDSLAEMIVEQMETDVNREETNSDQTETAIDQTKSITGVEGTTESEPKQTAAVIMTVENIGEALEDSENAKDNDSAEKEENAEKEASSRIVRVDEEKSKLPLTPRMTTRRLLKSESQKTEEAKLTNRLRSAKK